MGGQTQDAGNRNARTATKNNKTNKRTNKQTNINNATKSEYALKENLEHPRSGAEAAMRAVRTILLSTACKYGSRARRQTPTTPEPQSIEELS